MTRPAEFLAMLDQFCARLATVQGNLAGVRGVWEEAAAHQPRDPSITIAAARLGECDAEWHHAPNSDARRVVLYLHGGAYTICSIRTHRYLCGEVSRACAVPVVALDYRLAPEHPFPAALDDALAAYRALLAQGFDAASIALAGDSAGGGLCLALLLHLRDLGLTMPAAAFLIAPWVDLTLSSASLRTKGEHGDLPLRPEGLHLSALAYAGGLPLDDPRLSPLYADCRGLPPILIHVSTDERLLDDALRMASVLANADVAVQLDAWPDQPHIWHGYGWLIPEGLSALARAGEWVREKLPVSP